jgi:hypothetical protein
MPTRASSPGIGRIGRIVALLGLLALSASGAIASPLPTVKPIMACGNLMKLDLGYLKEAPFKLDSATVVTEGAPAPYCLVSGYAAPGVAFQVRLPTETWSQRMVMNGCGGYCGDLLSLPVSAGQGDMNSASSYAVAPSVGGVSDELPWAGSRHYRPGEQMSCEEDGHALRCR